jgi:hypothetical protein
VVVRRAARTFSTAAVAVALALVTAGCSHASSSAPPQVTVSFGGDKLALDPEQYCDGTNGHRYSTRPPLVTAGPGTRITFTVPASVAAHGWAVQVFDQHLEQPIGDVRVPKGTAVFDQITTSDVVPAAFYLVVVEDKSGACHDLSGAWPVGVIRTTKVPSTASPSAPAQG